MAAHSVFFHLLAVGRPWKIFICNHRTRIRSIASIPVDSVCVFFLMILLYFDILCNLCVYFPYLVAAISVDILTAVVAFVYLLYLFCMICVVLKICPERAVYKNCQCQAWIRTVCVVMTLVTIIAYVFGLWYYCNLPSVLWRCWLGDRKGIRPVKNRVVRCWRGYLSGARCRLAYGPADASATHCLLLQ